MTATPPAHGSRAPDEVNSVPAAPGIAFRGDWAPEIVYRAEAIHHWWNGWMVPNVTTETLVQVLSDASDTWSMVLSADTARIVSISPDLEPEEITLTPNRDGGTWTLDLGWTFEGAGGPYPPPLHTLTRPVPMQDRLATLIAAATTPSTSWGHGTEISINPGLDR